MLLFLLPVYASCLCFLCFSFFPPFLPSFTPKASFSFRSVSLLLLLTVPMALLCGGRSVAQRDRVCDDNVIHFKHCPPLPIIRAFPFSLGLSSILSLQFSYFFFEGAFLSFPFLSFHSFSLEIGRFIDLLFYILSGPPQNVFRLFSCPTYLGDPDRARQFASCFLFQYTCAKCIRPFPLHPCDYGHEGS